MDSNGKPHNSNDGYEPMKNYMHYLEEVYKYRDDEVFGMMGSTHRVNPNDIEMVLLAFGNYTLKQHNDNRYTKIIAG